MITVLIKEAMLIAAKIPVPKGFDGSKRSFTVVPEGARGSVGILWGDSQLYVSKSNGAGGVAVNKKGGSSIAIRKAGGWEKAWAMALACAGPEPCLRILEVLHSRLKWALF